MDTVYYTLNARTVKVSGGADLLTFTPAPTPAAPAGEVLDFDRCRRRLETKAAWKNLTQAADVEDVAPEEGEELLPAIPQPRSRRERAAGWLELCATAAIILVSLAATAAFLSLL